MDGGPDLKAQRTNHGPRTVGCFHWLPNGHVTCLSVRLPSFLSCVLQQPVSRLFGLQWPRDSRSGRRLLVPRSSSSLLPVGAVQRPPDPGQAAAPPHGWTGSDSGHRPPTSSSSSIVLHQILLLLLLFLLFIPIFLLLAILIFLLHFFLLPSS